jgi:hypothetical protein
VQRRRAKRQADPFEQTLSVLGVKGGQAVHDAVTKSFHGWLVVGSGGDESGKCGLVLRPEDDLLL